MTTLLSSSAFSEIELEFPNLFGGISISYYRGFEIFGFPIYWYGVIITVGVILAILYCMHRSAQFGADKDRVLDVAIVAIIGGFIGARAYYCIFQTLDPNSGQSYDLITAITHIRDGGLAIYGGIIGGFLVGFVMCRIRKVRFFVMCDIASMGFLIGQCIGRWGNFVNQEAFGAEAPADWLFGMTGSVISQQTSAGAVVHPCFLYESAWCLLGFIALHFYSKKLRSFDGETALLYIAWYGLGRALIEGLRTDSLMLGDVRISQLLAAASFVIAVILLIVFRIVTEKKGIPLYVNTEECAALLEADRQKAEADRLKREQRRAEKEKAESILIDDDEEEELPPEDGQETGEDAESSPRDETEENSESEE